MAEASERWPGTTEGFEALADAVARHCTCPPLARRISDGRQCAAHALLRDGTTLGRLMFYRSLAPRLQAEEWAA